MGESPAQDTAFLDISDDSAVATPPMTEGANLTNVPGINGSMAIQDRIGEKRNVLTKSQLKPPAGPSVTKANQGLNSVKGPGSSGGIGFQQGYGGVGYA
jgi:hypothetical protein